MCWPAPCVIPHRLLTHASCGVMTTSRVRNQPHGMLSSGLLCTAHVSMRRLTAEEGDVKPPPRWGPRCSSDPGGRDHYDGLAVVLGGASWCSGCGVHLCAKAQAVEHHLDEHSEA